MGFLTLSLSILIIIDEGPHRESIHAAMPEAYNPLHAVSANRIGGSNLRRLWNRTSRIHLGLPLLLNVLY
jgi:hypothetical protein